jgi:IclR family transcriptional regulator, acetate operon repressor
VRLGAEVPAEPRLRAVAQRPLMDLANATGALVTLSVQVGDDAVLVEVLPGTRRLVYEPKPGVQLLDTRYATVRAHERARQGDLRPVIDTGGVDRRVGCVAAPLRISPTDVAAVALMLPGGRGIPQEAVAATRRAAGQIAARLSTEAGR